MIAAATAVLAGLAAFRWRAGEPLALRVSLCVFYGSTALAAAAASFRAARASSPRPRARAQDGAR